jgi:hypothetical protein
VAGTQPKNIPVRSEVLDRIAARFTPMPANGIDPPHGRDTIQLRIGTLVADTSWTEIAELTGVSDAHGDPDIVVAVFPAIQEAVRRHHGLTKRLMIRIWEEPTFSDRITNRLRPGSLQRRGREWLVWGAGHWHEEP